MLSEPCPAGKSLPSFPGAPKFPPTCRQGAHRGGDMSATVGGGSSSISLCQGQSSAPQERAAQALPTAPNIFQGLSVILQCLLPGFCPSLIPERDVEGAGGGRARCGSVPAVPAVPTPRGRCLAPVAGLEEERGGGPGAGGAQKEEERGRRGAERAARHHRAEGPPAGRGPGTSRWALCDPALPPRGQRGGQGAGVTHRGQPESSARCPQHPTRDGGAPHGVCEGR